MGGWTWKRAWAIALLAITAVAAAMVITAYAGQHPIKAVKITIRSNNSKACIPLYGGAMVSRNYTIVCVNTSMTYNSAHTREQATSGTITFPGDYVSPELLSPKHVHRITFSLNDSQDCLDWALYGGAMISKNYTIVCINTSMPPIKLWKLAPSGTITFPGDYISPGLLPHITVSPELLPPKLLPPKHGLLIKSRMT